MTVDKCVKCGTEIDNPQRRNRRCPPCCEECKAAVEKETRKNYSTWPSNWRGGWLWDSGTWERVFVPSEDYTD